MKTRIPSLVRHHRPLIIPKLIDLDSIMQSYPPSKRQVNRDCLLYLISLIYSKSLFNKKQYECKDFGFIPLKMEYLNKKFYASRINLDYLIELGILESDYKYSPNNYSIGYRINPVFLNGETQCKFFKKRIYYSKIDSVNSSDNNLPIPQYLARPFLEKRIFLEKTAANKILEEVYERSISVIKHDMKLDKEKMNKRIKDLEYALVFQKEKVARICNNDYSGSYFIDNTSFRFHSLITTLKKQVRPLIKLNGQDSVSLDLKNSQPFFLLLLFKRAFYDTRNRGRKILRMLELDKNNIKYREYIINNNINPLMIGKLAESIENTEGSVYEFCHAIRQGSLYELFMSKRVDINTLSEEEFKTLRDEVKEQFLVFMYDEPGRKFSRKSVKGIVYSDYVDIFKFIDFLKQFKTGEDAFVRHSYLKTVDKKSNLLIKVDSGFKRLSNLIQSLESKVILEIVCSEIAKKHPEMPFLTVHDSIIIPKNYKKAVLKIMNSEIERVTWEIPQIKVEE